MRKIGELNERIKAITALDLEKDPDAYQKFLAESKELFYCLQPFLDIQQEMQNLRSSDYIINSIATSKAEEVNVFYKQTALKSMKQKVNSSV
ncbi:MAG: hypothetical protein K0S12_2325, partial [Bacteroidetes bacterium]|nr:hypothetical protein [Bacteroidota bacterium]